jgi:uncharacterized membrane protein
MSKGRLEAFSDGVLAIIITIMVLELKLPHGALWEDLAPLYPVFMGYTLSFIYIGIYWNNHHHMLHAASKVSAGVMWANLHLLFWLSLFPFATGWMGESHFAPLPVALYGVVQLMAGCAYYILARILAAHHGPDSKLAKALGKDFKGIVSLVIYAAAVAIAWLSPAIAGSLYALVALMWLVPDRRMERALGD